MPSLRDRSELVNRLRGSEVFRDYQQAFQALTGLPLALRAAASYQSPLSGAKLGNPFCALMAARNKSCSACLGLQERLESASREKSCTLECFAGLTESAVPVRVGATVVAFLRTGQVRFQAPTTRQVRQAVDHAAAFDRSMDRAALEAAYRQTLIVSRSQYSAVLRMLEIFAQHLSALTNQLMVAQAQAEAPAITRARAFIAEHLTEELSLPQVSRAVGMSSFYFCKNFKKSTGLTFTDYLSRVRVEAVKQLLLNPHKRVSEAAFEAGFQSLSQFNRAFHRIAGQPPSTYRDQLHGAAPVAPSRRFPALAA
ncbi:MAG: helix-turn-helix domain-containing protein [Opitutaceae bacterium]